MASAKEKRVVKRLEDIKVEASALAANADAKAPWVDARTAANLAEEAAELALELVQGEEE